MVAKITTGSNVYGALSYNGKKVEEEKGSVLSTHILREPADGIFNAAETAEDIKRWMPSHVRTEKPVIHISLNPDPKDNLSDEQLSEIAAKYMDSMGWGEQPYIVFKHTDIERAHIHIVSLQVGRDGRKIKDSRRNERSVAITEELEKEYGLHPAKGQKRPELWQLKAVDQAKGNLKRQIASVIKPAVSMYGFQTMGEFRALLSLYNIGVEEVRGERGGKPYRGLLYTVLDVDGQKAEATPLKSSLFGKEYGAGVLEKKMKKSGERIKSGGQTAKTKAAVLASLNASRGGGEIRANLREKGIDLVLRYGNGGRLFGVTFIDHNSRVVLNGSALGKEFSANAIGARFCDLLMRGNRYEDFQDGLGNAAKGVLHQIVQNEVANKQPDAVKEDNKEVLPNGSLLQSILPKQNINNQSEPVLKKKKQMI